MVNWLVTRHAGASRWLEENGFETALLVSHLDPGEINTGDIVIGTLPINIVADLHTKGVRYFHLSLSIPPEWRGRELTAQQMDDFGACIEEYVAYRVEGTEAANRPPAITPEH